MLSNLKALLADLKKEGGWLFPLFPPVYVLLLAALLNALLGEACPPFVTGALLTLTAGLSVWGLWAASEDICPTAAQSVADAPGYVIRPRQLLAEIAASARFQRKQNVKGRKLAHMLAEAYLGSILIVLTVWAIAAYLVYAAACLALDAGAWLLTWCDQSRIALVNWWADLGPNGRQGVGFSAMGCALLLLAIVAVVHAFRTSDRRLADAKAEAAELLKKWPYLTSAQNVFGRSMWLTFGGSTHYLVMPFNIENPRDIRAMHEALMISALVERHKRGHAVRDPTGEILPPRLDPQKGWLVDTIESDNGRRQIIYAYDVKCGLSPYDLEDPERRIKARRRTIIDAPDQTYANARALNIIQYSENWLHRFWNHKDASTGYEWKTVYRDKSINNGQVPVFSPILLAVDQQTGKPLGTTEKGSAEWGYPDEWAASASVPSPEEVWLAKMADRLRFYVEQATHKKIPPCVFQWSERDPKGPGLHGLDALGRCYYPQKEKPARIWINASQSDRGAAITLLHELIHAGLSHEDAHGPEFVKVAAALGFRPPYTQGHEGTFSGEWLDRELKAVGQIPRRKPYKSTAKAR